jgi:hypothetical protein
VGGGGSVAGGLTLGGAAQSIPEPGGRGTLSLGFPAFFGGAGQNRDVSWTMARIRDGAIMRIPLRASFQLVPKAEIFGTPASFTRARTYSPAHNDPTGASAVVWDPKIPVSANASKGDVAVQVNMNGLAPVLDVGHVIGSRSGSFDFAHEVMEISYSGETATLTVTPPLRRALNTSSFCFLRPTMLATCLNPDAAAGVQVRRQFQGLGTLEFVEALV